MIFRRPLALFQPLNQPYLSVRFKSNLASSEILFSVMDGMAAAGRQPAKRLLEKYGTR